jgi:nicotinamidase-related amidase
LLDYLGAHTLIVTGMRTDSCVLFTASDAFLREFSVVVPSDATVTFDDTRHKETLGLMERELKAQIMATAEIDFGALQKARSGG